MVSGAIDPAQYRQHGSLGLPYGTKNGNTSFTIREYVRPSQSYFLTMSDGFVIEDVDTSSYNVKPVSTFCAEANGDFVKQALEHVDTIPDYTKDAFDRSFTWFKGHSMYIKRRAPSHCSICNKRHDNDNTLKLFFDSDKRYATWNCIRAKTKSKCFFRVEQPVADDEIEAFIYRKSKPEEAKPVEAKPVEAKPVEVKPRAWKNIYFI
ncbi:hypothetical protein PF005_g25122 [Phytophthora fragariae]|nr:hypothetical protein PF011_g23093 [Phytophthora fragariae]KAE9075915.1 hypothetical protein PF010_g24113 [Phytophthora fragariae]KAE9176070.1 hypothetical protein PF005_g25122 [Phytophthora fragariae]KAE9187598.1 hypothetical protein PF002_g25555 [Phytophthora fragariae]KAE9280942.1 hypothetical protein PF001_g23996 [Phytophthora fragariae]